jgi:NADH-quinone oxidoreductase subunit N
MASAPLLPLLLPVILVLAGGLVTLVAEPFLGREQVHRRLPWLALVFLLGAGVALALAPTGQLHGIFLLDGARRWLGLAVIAAAACALGGLQQSLVRDRHPAGEPYALTLFASTGVLLMVLASDALALFVALETAALAVYALVGLRRHRAESNEGLFKYLVMGAVFGAVFLYGVALHYGATGGTRFGAAIAPGREQLELIAYALMTAGLLFKLGVVPFHSWAPDAYTGAPVAVTGFMGAAIKVGGIAALATAWLGLAAAGSGAALRLDQPLAVVATARPYLGSLWLLLTIAAILSILVGNFAALKQTSARRLIAFSSIAHAGYMLLGFSLPGTEIDLRPLCLYAVGYAIATAGALTALAALAGTDDTGDDLASLAGRGRANPLMGVGLTVFLASFAGLPPTLGFLGKFAVLAQVVAQPGGWIIALVAVGAAVVGAAVYLRLLVTLWAGEPREPVASGPGLLTGWGVAVAAAATVALIAVPTLIVGGR